MGRKIICFFLMLALFCSSTATFAQGNEIKIAFMADVHFADVYPDVKTIPANTVPTAENGESVLIRSMEAQLHSTRLFNENYFAFTAALDDAVKRGIKIIALPGDFSDDGQPLHIKGLNKIMNHYVENHGVSFFMINGNHDPTRPYGKKGGKNDFLGKNGMAQPVMSEEGMYVSNLEKENPTLVLEDIKEWGYEEIVQELSAHGFFPNEKEIYWETPFSKYNYEQYDFRQAVAASKLDKRTCHLDSGDTGIPDVSYLVEPVEGLWLLALDANVYIPKQDGTGFHGAGIGYNEVLKHKKYLLEWTGKVVKEANRLGKTLIAFSHYPMLDFNDGASEEMKELFGEKSFQAYRNPGEWVGKTFADLGLKMHVGGHMHLNDTGVLTTQNGNTLVNIQTPSFGAFIPGYKIMTLKNTQVLDVETIVLDTVPNFKSFFGLYENEFNFLKSNFPDRVWDKKILASTSYVEFTKSHLEELIRLRFLPNDWPKELLQFLVNLNGWELFVLSNMERNLSEQELQSITMSNRDYRTLDLLSEDMQTKLNIHGLNRLDFTSWNGKDLIADFYMVKYADELALKHIEPTRLECYKLLFKSLLENDKSETIVPLKQFANIFQKQITAEPSANFSIDLEKGQLSRN